MLLSRRQLRSIFHLGEEGGDDRRGGQHVKNVDDTTRRLGGRRNPGRQRRERDAVDNAVVGLRILVQLQHSQNARASHIVLKQMVLPKTPAARHRRAACGCFLRACSLCRRELSPDKDVYMYRGDQGFCSEECRWKQILIDEAREREAMIKRERRALSIQRHHMPRLAPAAAVRGAPRRLLAVS